MLHGIFKAYRRHPFGFLVSLLFVAFILGVCATVGYVRHFAISRNKVLYTNSDYIEGLYSRNVDLHNDMAVFRYVFQNLTPEVTVYTTENYYYWKFYSQGKAIGGAIGLSAHNRDQGYVGFGYIERSDDPNVPPDPNPQIGGGGLYGVKEGISIKKINAFKYAVTFEGKTVVFNLYDVGMSPPKKGGGTLT